jgi:hypothetical protein
VQERTRFELKYKVTTKRRKKDEERYLSSLVSRNSHEKESPT